MEIHPLLYIVSPSYFEADKSLTQSQLEESTSIYERQPPETIRNTLIARQLHYFSKPLKEPRMLLFVLASGEKVWASIDQIDGCEVKLNSYDTKRIIHANDIQAIYSS
ncbi:4-diphosphocytidyl-2C-methyl-D-erythritol kinase [Lysinibacillus sp. 2017]|uniref:4-diphosphocytidyl-2C-methyl-D-erythritol kinase n=1 Tax=unclassified Lysinibacillus TaxID=2636778 RepID=UPI000D529C25|nr:MULTISPECIES: 4-diphosphocytidyl-2C-methyl-D-erythritol kinase [unclassified Lysinibacillus]AWE06462.1 4-diphosphocytidyl-2C-methyl-D-erythritol kinase [Lysinibacillus sp. 2017]TGN31192.1 4-diphosphocytidyl-2C-methyl-D-erythritol kinase [Lysinibacillus sp. S2017]